MKEFSVLTGDMVESSKLSSSEVTSAMKALGDGAKAIEVWSTGPTYFTQCRGDGWQMYVANADYALRASLVMKAHLRAHQKGLATRISIANGREGRPMSSNLNAENSGAFVRSGQLLDAMARGVTLDHARGGAMAAVFAIAGCAFKGVDAKAGADHGCSTSA